MQCSSPQFIGIIESCVEFINNGVAIDGIPDIALG